MNHQRTAGLLDPTITVWDGLKRSIDRRLQGVGPVDIWNVVDIDSDTGKVEVVSLTAGSPRWCSKLRHVTCMVGDRVLVQQVGGHWIVVGALG